MTRVTLVETLGETTVLALLQHHISQAKTHPQPSLEGEYQEAMESYFRAVAEKTLKNAP